LGAGVGPAAGATLATLATLGAAMGVALGVAAGVALGVAAGVAVGAGGGVRVRPPARADDASRIAREPVARGRNHAFIRHPRDYPAGDASGTKGEALIHLAELRVATLRQPETLA